MLIPDDPSCPRCQGAVPLGRLYAETPTNRLGLLAGDGFSINSTGIICPTCGCKLRVLQWWVLLASVLGVLALGVVGFFAVTPFLTERNARWLVVPLIIVFGVAAIVVQRYARRFARLQIVEDDTGVVFPLSKH